LYAADSFLQLNSNPDTVATLPAAGILEARPFALDELRRYEAGTPLDQLNTGDGGATFIPSANDPDAARAARFYAGALQFTQRPTEAFGYTISYHGLKADRTLRNGPAGVRADAGLQPFGGSSHAEFEGRVHTLSGRTDFRLGRAHLVTAGYEFERESYANRSFVFNPAGSSISIAPGSESDVSAAQRSHAFFVQDQVRLLGDRLQLSAAFRAQAFSLTQPDFNPAANAPYRGRFDAPPAAYTGDGSVAYTFRSMGTKLRGHVGNGYRTPSLYERFGTFFSGFSNSFNALGDPTLRPERSIAFDAGIDQSAFDNRLRASATYFYTRLQEVVGFGDVTTFDRPFGGYLNTGGGLARGLELSLATAPTRSLDLNAAYTYTNSDQRRPAAAEGVVSAFVIPEHQFSLVATQRVTRRLLLNFDLTAMGEYLAPIFSNTSFRTRVYRFGGTVKADAGASYTLPITDARGVRFFGQVENLFDREYYESGFRMPGATARAGVQFNF
ncbi:MAG: TonB-dependent receptor, partial [Pyrinomonadaceae bacterium]